MKEYVLDEAGYEWLGEEYKRKSRLYPRTINVTATNGKKMKKQVDEKQVVFWSQKYATRAKAEREAALVKARDLTRNPGKYTRATSYGAAKYVKKIEFDKETGEILTASSILDINDDLIHEEEALDGYYMLLTSEMDTPDDKIIDMYRGLWRIEESFKITKSELEALPVYVWTNEHIEAHFLTCFVALALSRILEMKLEHKYSAGRILDSLSKANCSLVQQNYYMFDYFDEVLKDIGEIMNIDFAKRIRTLGDIKQALADTKKK
jgi:transposase